MASVTSIIECTRQPRGGYLKSKEFKTFLYTDGLELRESLLHPSTIGLATDYLLRYALVRDKQKAFAISILGALYIGKEKYAWRLLDKIKGLDEESIISGCLLVQFDVYARRRLGGVPKKFAEPDQNAIYNIGVMLKRGITFFKNEKPITKVGFTFEGGYTQKVDSGDGDYLTGDTLWDMKVSKNEINSKESLQILMYYLMGLHSKKQEFQTIKYIGIFNPRKNKAYRIDVDEISAEVKNKVQSEVIGYAQKDIIIFKEKESEFELRWREERKKLEPYMFNWGK